MITSASQEGFSGCYLTAVLCQSGDIVNSSPEQLQPLQSTRQLASNQSNDRSSVVELEKLMSAAFAAADAISRAQQPQFRPN